jgi:hypothetical protein
LPFLSRRGKTANELQHSSITKASRLPIRRSAWQSPLADDCYVLFCCNCCPTAAVLTGGSLGACLWHPTDLVWPKVWLLLKRCHEAGSGPQAQRQWQLGGVGAGPTLLPYRPAALGLFRLRTPNPLPCWLAHRPTTGSQPPTPTPTLSPQQFHTLYPPLTPLKLGLGSRKPRSQGNSTYALRNSMLCELPFG